jgi:hypothetical protein
VAKPGSLSSFVSKTPYIKVSQRVMSLRILCIYPAGRSSIDKVGLFYNRSRFPLDDHSSHETQLGSFTAYIGYTGSGNIDHVDFAFYDYAAYGNFVLYSYQDHSFQRDALNSYSDFIDWAVDNIRPIDNILTVYNNDGEREIIRSFVTLTPTGISEDSPSSVQEPNSTLLLSSGLVGIRLILCRPC